MTGFRKISAIHFSRQTMKNTQRLVEIMAHLRHPETGCAWDVKQDFASLTPYMIEEAYEVIDAIERNNFDDLKEELGDLLLQVVFHARIAEEKALFDFEAVAAGICDKLTQRHPHVFGDVVYDTDEQRKTAWEEAKSKERARKSSTEAPLSVLHGVAGSLPALLFADKIQDRAASHGFDWPEISPVFDKVEEELQEVKEAIEEGDQAHIEEEVGDLIFVAVNLARHLKVNPELALKASNRKFTRRFHYIEEKVSRQQRTLRDCQLAELDALWDEAKANEK